MSAYSYSEVYEASVKYFDGDDFAAKVFVDKYALQNQAGEYLELTPTDMHRRIAKEFARIEQKYPNPLSEDEIFALLDRYKYIVPQGSPMYGIGNEHFIQSLGNCFVKGTTVFTTNDGPKCIEDIEIGDSVPTHSGAVKKVVQKHKNLLNGRKIYDFKCLRTPTISVTDNHKFLSISKEQMAWGMQPTWNSMDYLRVGDYIAIPHSSGGDSSINIDTLDIIKASGLPLLDIEGEDRYYEIDATENTVGLITRFKNGSKGGRKTAHPINRNIIFNKDFAYFAGLWLGDGCVFNRDKMRDVIKGITFTFGAKEKKLVNFVSSFGEKAFGIPADINDNSHIDNTTQVIFNSTALGNVFNHLFGRGFAGKKLPKFIYNCDYEIVNSLLLGLLDSDGTVTGNGDIRVVLKNKNVITSVYHLARKVGIPLGISHSTKESTYRLDFPKNSNFIDAISRTYSDDRIKLAQDRKEATTGMVTFGGMTYMRIESKNVSDKKDEYVYTFGVEDDHSYDVEGLVCQNCFVVESPFDSYGGILKTDQEMAQLMKRRAGVGTDIANIRPKGMPTKNAAKTTDGIGVFMERFSNTCREVAQSGRRGALMLSNSIDHPEIERFINIKEDNKKVTGANISVRITDAFMKAVKDDTDYTLKWPVDSKTPEITKVVKAKDVWNQIIHSAWKSAEPGVLFWDTIINNSPADIYAEKYPNMKTSSTNPCFSGDTLIAVADGRKAVAIKDLAASGNDVSVYSIDPITNNVSIKRGKHPRATGYDQKLVRVTLDDGSYLDTTPNHKFLLLNGEKVQAQNLKNGDSLPQFTSVLGLDKISADQDYDNCSTQSAENHSFVKKPCEVCNKVFYVVYDNREVSICSNKCASIYLDDSERKKALDQRSRQAKVYSDLKFKLGKTPNMAEWKAACKENNLSYHVGKSSGYKNFKEVATAGNLYNHKVVSVVELEGTHTVYNITVDDNHTVGIITDVKGEGSNKSYSGIFTFQCGELPLGLDSCRLLVVNLLPFVKNPFTKQAEFDYKYFGEVAQKAQRLMDDLVDLEIEKIKIIIKKIKNDPEPASVKAIELNLWTQFLQSCEQGRRTGTGITALGDCLAAMGVKYGSKKSIEITREIYKQLMLNAYKSSSIMAQERGAFPIFDAELEKGHPFISKVLDQDPSIKKIYSKYGRRNVALLTTAPTGSVSTQTQTTSGIEPAFMLSYVRRKKHNPSDKNARIDFVDALGDQWQEFTIYHHGVKAWMDVTGETDITKSPYHGATANEIDWNASVLIQAAAQESIDHSISKTCNLPEDVSEEVVSEVYMKAWETGCKGFTVYRDKCRDGVLIGKSDKPKILEDGRPLDIPTVMAPKRPIEVECDIKKVKVQGAGWTIFVGLLNGRPYEIFGGLSKHIDIPNKMTKGRLIKNGKVEGIATYNLVIGKDDDEIKIKDVVNVFENANYGTLTRAVSLSMRHGTPIQYIVEQLQKDKHSDMTSFSKVLSRVLKSYITDGTKSTDKTCPTCKKEDSIYYQEGCLLCINCGFSKC